MRYYFANIRPLIVCITAATLMACGSNHSSPDTNENAAQELPPLPEDLAALTCLPQPNNVINMTLKPEDPNGNGDTHTMPIQSTLSPGQSGFFPSPATCTANFQPVSCAAPDQDPSAYPEHVDSQREIYWNSQFKPGEFLDTTSTTPVHTLNITTPVTDTVTIYRDDFGVPVVYATTGFGVWYGHGYALAEDRLFLLDQARRQARGTSSEVLGTGTMGADVMTRTLTYTEAEYQQIRTTLSQDAKDALDGQVAGANAYIDLVLASGSGAARTTNPLMPQEFVALNYDPTPINDIDLMALGVLITRFVASNGGDEMENVKALQALQALHGEAVGRQIFKDVLWVDDKMADATIPDQEFTNIPTPVALREQVFTAQADYASALPLELADGPGTGAYVPPPVSASLMQKLRQYAITQHYQSPYPASHIAAVADRVKNLPKRVSASYMMIASPDITANAETLLINGPQLGYSYPSLLAEVEVHGGGYDARGVTVPGLPVVGIGYGERSVWGFTTGESKTIDSFVVEVVSDDGTQYLHDGQTKTMDCRMENFTYRSASNGAPNVADPVPGSNSVDLEVCRTVHGPVVARSDDGRFARAVEYGMWLREIETVEGILDWNRVDSFTPFLEGVKKVTWNENVMYADADGNIAYFHPGLHPWRHPVTDQRLPNRGDGSQDHCGQLTFNNRPQTINPDRGYVHNWNNKPSHGWGDGVGGAASQEPSGIAGRNVNFGPLVEAELPANGGDGLSYTDLVEIDRRIGRIDPKAAALLPAILSCDGSCNLTAEEQALIDILNNWDQQHYNDAIDTSITSLTANTNPNEDPDPTQQPAGVLDTPGATIFSEIVQAMVDELFVNGRKDPATGDAEDPNDPHPANDPLDELPADFVRRHEVRGTHPYDAGTFHKLLAKLFDPVNNTSIPLTYDWTRGRSNDEFIKDAMAIALSRMQDTYNSTDPNDFKRIHARSPVCALASPLAGPCISMPHQDRGSWLKLVGFIP